MIWTPEQPFQALALTGGGYRGLFTAKALQVMEQSAGEPIARRFDLITGTSIGGIVALAAAFEIPMARVVQVFQEQGPAIFPKHRRPAFSISGALSRIRGVARPLYEVSALRSAITSLIPSDATLGDALHPVAIPAVNVTRGEPQVFKTRHVAEWNRDWKFKAVDVALATSAAPTFFELAELRGPAGEVLGRYADGGLFANAPDLIALHEANHFFDVEDRAVRLLSIGTTSKSYSISFKSSRGLGVWGWMRDQRLFNVIITAQQQFVDQITKHRLGDSYFRLDASPSPEQVTDLGLDVADDAAQQTLTALAEKAVTDVLKTKLAPYLAHRPQLSVIKEV